MGPMLRTKCPLGYCESTSHESMRITILQGGREGEGQGEGSLYSLDSEDQPVVLELLCLFRRDADLWDSDIIWVD